MISELLYGPFNSYEDKFRGVEINFLEGFWTDSKDIFSIIGFLVFDKNPHINYFEKMPLSVKEHLSIKIYDENEHLIKSLSLENKEAKTFLVIEPILTQIRSIIAQNKKCNFFLKIEDEDISFREEFYKKCKNNKFSEVMFSDSEKAAFVEDQIKELDEKMMFEEFKTFFWHFLPPNTGHLDEYFISHCFSSSQIDYKNTLEKFDLILNKKKGSY